MLVDRLDAVRRRGLRPEGMPDRTVDVRLRIAAFLAVPLLVLLAVSAGSALLSERLARSSALDAADRTADELTRYVVAPALAQLMDGVPGALKELDQRVQDRLADGSVEGLVIWRPPQEVVYSSDAAAERVALPMTATLRSAAAGRSVAEIAPVPGPNGPEGPKQLVEVYRPLSLGGATMVVAVFFRNDDIQRDADLLRNRIVPVALGALIVLQLFQVPLGISLFRRVRRQDTERAGMLVRSLTAADQERRAIAADVHDGPVQDLAGVAYALGSLRASAPPEAHASLDGVIDAVRDAVSRLRRLMVDVYPPDLDASAMTKSLADLAESVRAGGSEVDLDVEPVPGLSSSGAVLLYRTVKEALSDDWCAVVPHHCWVRFGPTVVRDRAGAVLEVGHDCAVPPSDEEGPAVAVRLMRARYAELGGSLDVTTSDRGILLTAALPLIG